MTRWLLTHPDALPEGDRLKLKAVLANCPELDVLAKHVRTFAHMVTDLQGDQLPQWIKSARAATGLPSLSRFAQRLERDLDAVVAGLSQPWNSGVVEGHVNRAGVPVGRQAGGHRVEVAVHADGEAADARQVGGRGLGDPVGQAGAARSRSPGMHRARSGWLCG